MRIGKIDPHSTNIVESLMTPSTEDVLWTDHSQQGNIQQF